MDYLGYGVSGCRNTDKNIHLTRNNLLVEVQKMKKNYGNELSIWKSVKTWWNMHLEN